MAGRRGNIVCIQTEEHRRDYFRLRYSSSHEASGRAGCPKRRHKGAGCMQEVIAFTRYDGNSLMVSLKRRPSIYTESKDLVISKKTVSVSRFSSKFLLILSTSRASCRVVLRPGRNLNCSSLRRPREFISAMSRETRSSRRAFLLCPVD